MGYDVSSFIYYIKQLIFHIINMREEDINSNTLDDKKYNLYRKRAIRKNKLNQITPTYEDVNTIDTSKLTKEERAKIQKVKNRESAQRSRDMHKDYVVNLQREVFQLRHLKEYLIDSRKICARCQQEMQEKVLESNESEPLYEKTKSEVKEMACCEHPQFEIQSQLNSFHNIDYFVEEQSLMRVDSNHHSSYLSTIFFIAMIVVAALICGNNNKQNITMSRALMQIPELPEVSDISSEDKESHQNNSVQQSKRNETALAPIESPIHSGLVQFNDEDCLNSLVNKSAPGDRRSLRSYGDNPQGQTLMANKESILLCTVRSPKGINHKLQKIRSSLIKLYLLGSEIKQMITSSNLMIPFKNNNIQINGLYKVSAEIIDVDLVADHNCLL